MTNISRKERLQRRRKKAEKIIFMIGITAVIFVVATYAWFIGTTQISVTDFTLSVKSGDGLEISLDGISFDTSVAISKDILTALADTTDGTYKAANGNKNYWTEEGLEPISTVGEMDTTHSVLKLFNKTSISSLNGGYKLRSNQIDNATAGETGGYVAFDLFIKNKSGEGYTKDFDHGIDEGVYLIGDSSVSLTAQGADGETLTGGDGIENSIRLAFMQIGRIDMTETDSSKIQGISCADTDSDPDAAVTQLCNRTHDDYTNGLGMTWNIWEPNDMSHIASAKTHFNAICKARTDVDTYSGACGITDEQWAGTTYIKSYPVRTNVEATDNVNVYDGHNTYNATIGTDKFLVDFDYFTDTEKNLTDKKEIFFISPNSITKLRVYIYLEGQDIDNYDLGSYGKQIKIKFGFTKDKFGISGEDEEEEEVVEPEAS